MAPGRQSSVLVPALVKYFVLGLLLTVVLILGSGRTGWMRAWVYIGATLLTQILVGFRLARVNPDLLAERRQVGKGTKSWDKLLAALIAIVGPIAMWLTAAFDVRSHWPPPVPAGWSAAGLSLCGLGFAITGWAMLTNRFFSATVRIQSERGHKVIDGGPYHYVRHPGYVGAGLFTLAFPIALGSWIAMVPAVLIVAVLVVRTAFEDRTLRAELPGYQEYAERVPARLVPHLW